MRSIQPGKGTLLVLPALIVGFIFISRLETPPQPAALPPAAAHPVQASPLPDPTAAPRLRQTGQQRLRPPARPPAQFPASALPTNPAEPAAAALDELIRSVANSDPNSPHGLYAEGVLSLRILPQPAGDSAYISSEADVATLFQDALPYKTTGLLAHNFLAGRHFFNLQAGQELVLVYGDSRLQRYRVSEIADYQRLNIADLRSDFLSLSANRQLSADELFDNFYEIPGQLVLQTCIERAGLSIWGVRFIRALPQD